MAHYMKTIKDNLFLCIRYICFSRFNIGISHVHYYCSDVNIYVLAHDHSAQKILHIATLHFYVALMINVSINTLFFFVYDYLLHKPR